MRLVAMLALVLLSTGAVAEDSLKKVLEDAKKVDKEVREGIQDMFSIDYTQARKQLKIFKSTSSLKEKMMAATELALVEAKRAMSKEANSLFSADEVKILGEAQDYVAILQREAEQFEAGLTKEEIKTITQDSPDSLFRMMGKVFLLNRPQCFAGDYAALKKKMGVKHLKARAEWIMMLTSLYEQQHLTKYIERLRTLLTTPKYAKNGESLAVYYETAALKIPVPGSEEKRKIAQAENALIKAGVSRSGVKAYVSQQAVLSPQCLGGLNIPLLRHLRGE